MKNRPETKWVDGVTRTHLTLEERKKIQSLLESGVRAGQLYKHMEGRSVDVLRREARRGIVDGRYDAESYHNKVRGADITTDKWFSYCQSNPDKIKKGFLSLEEKKEISKLLKQGKSVLEIAVHLNRNANTISAEINKSGGKSSYDPNASLLRRPKSRWTEDDTENLKLGIKIGLSRKMLYRFIGKPSTVVKSFLSRNPHFLENVEKDQKTLSERVFFLEGRVEALTKAIEEMSKDGKNVIQEVDEKQLEIKLKSKYT